MRKIEIPPVGDDQRLVQEPGGSGIPDLRVADDVPGGQERWAEAPRPPRTVVEPDQRAS